MDFKLHKPTHLFALFLLILSLLIIDVVPMFSFFQSFPSTGTAYEDLPAEVRLIFELFLVAISLLLVIGLMVVIPFLWYYLVNRLRIPEIMSRLQLRREKLGMAVLWGIIGAVGALAISFAIELILLRLGVDLTNASNIPQLEQLLSLPAIVILVSIQPIAEEIFFRGFLFDKISSYTKAPLAILITAALFGIAHLSYGMMYTALMAGIIGAVFGVVVWRTKNLYAGIAAHIFLNVTSITVYILGKSLGF